MRALIAFDKFKDALTAQQACRIAADILREQHPDWYLDLCPLTDGGEGFANILTESASGDMHTASVTGPRAAPVSTQFGLVPLTVSSTGCCAASASRQVPCGRKPSSR